MDNPHNQMHSITHVNKTYWTLFCIAVGLDVCRNGISIGMSKVATLTFPHGTIEIGVDINSDVSKYSLLFIINNLVGGSSVLASSTLRSSIVWSSHDCCST